MTFTAIDFETAHPKQWSICQVGLVRVENGRIIDKVSMLVQPPKNFYWDRFIEIHGITPSKTSDSPYFDEVWTKIKPYIEDQVVVAHNMAFDGTCLKQALEYYYIAQPKYQSVCTYKIYGKNLKTLCTIHRIHLKHHDALSDAMACAHLYRRWVIGK